MNDLLKNKWVREVREVRSFLDQTYTVKIGNNVASSGDPDYQYGWGKIGVDKFCYRVNPQLRGEGSDELHFVASLIRRAVRDAVAFGNSTIIVDPYGNARVSVPENGHAYCDAFGVVTYTEQIGDIFFRSIQGGSAFVSSDGVKWEETEHATFSIFYNHDGAHPFGASRITQSIRKTLRSASRAKLRAEIASNYRAYPQTVFNGLWDELLVSTESDDEAAAFAESVQRLKSGVTNIIGLPKDPSDGKNISIEEITSADFTPFIALRDSYAKDVAAAFNCEPREFGVAGPVEPSADALYASKEDLVVEINEWEDSIIDTLQELVNYVASVKELTAPKLNFGNPATPSQASQADAFVKLASVVPQLKYSAAALQWAGLPNELIQEVVMSAEEWATDAGPGEQDGQ